MTMPDSHNLMTDRFAVQIRAKNFKAGYNGSCALRAQNLKLQGNIIAVVGHNGAGKSTLIKSILGLIPNLSGSIISQEITKNSIRTLTPEGDMAFCPETGSVFADISVESYVKFWCRVKHQDPNYYQKEGSAYIELLKLAPLFPKLGRELSKGQRRRVQTAIGFLSRPRLFLFDEPFDGLDVQKTSELAEIISMHQKEMAFVVSSHRMDVVERLADIVIVLQEGSFISCGSVQKVCTDLCERSIVIRNMRDAASMLPMLKKEFPTSLAVRVGNQIRLTGGGLHFEQISNLIRRHDSNGANLNPTQPSLVDAMNYHLKEMERV